MTTPVPVVAIEQAWPGRRSDLSAEVPSLPVAERLADRRALVLVAAAERYATHERFGLGVWLLVHGPTYVEGGVVVPDDRPDVAGLMARWCQRQSPTLGVSTLSEFFNWKDGPFRTYVYTGRGFLVSADLGRTLGLCCEHWSEARGRTTRNGEHFWEEGFTLWLPTWSKEAERHDGRREPRSVSSHLPPIRVKTAGVHGYFAEFRSPPGGARFGIRNDDGSPYRGRFRDVVPGAFTLDGIDSHRLGDHCDAFGLSAVDVPAAVALDETGATVLLEAAHATWKLALRVDDEGAKWLTTAEDREREQLRLDLSRLQSPGGLATAIFRRAGVAPLLAKYAKPSDDDLDRWTSAHFGGWQTAEGAGSGLSRCVDVDQVAAYPTNARLLGAWRYCTAEQLVERDVTDQVRALVSRVARGDFDPLFDPATFGPDGLGCTLCELRPDGDLLPIEASEPGRRTGGYAIRPVFSDLRLARSVYDVLRSALSTRRPPEVVGATTLRPVGRQTGLRRRLPLYEGLVVDLEVDDPIAALVRLRDAARSDGDERRARSLRVLVNAMAYGNFARLDQVRRRVDGRYVLRERPADYTFPPLAASVTALTRLFVALAEQLVSGGGQ